MKFLGRVNADGSGFNVAERARLLAHLRTLKGQIVEVAVARPERARSDAQNRYYWGVVVETLALYTGYAPDEMHDALKAKFLAEEDLVMGLTRIGSTATLSTVEFGAYLERVCAWAHCELGCYIPAPNEAGDAAA